MLPPALWWGKKHFGEHENQQVEEKKAEFTENSSNENNASRIPMFNIKQLRNTFIFAEASQ